MKKNNESRFYKDWTVKKLKDEAKSLYASIYGYECYGTSDLRMYDGVMQELDNRGIEMQTSINFI